MTNQQGMDQGWTVQGYTDCKHVQCMERYVWSRKCVVKDRCGQINIQTK